MSKHKKTKKSSRKPKPKIEFKVRSLAQRIGALGESLIPTWAIRNGLSATKIGPEDYGLDFFISALESHGKTEVFKGKAVVSQCKSSTELPGYVKIEKADANLYVNSTAPVLILAVDVTSEKILHLFVDEAMIERLIDFLQSSNESLNINVGNEFMDDSKISSTLFIATSPYKVSQLQIARRNALLKIHHPSTHSELTISSSGAGLKLYTPNPSELINSDALFSVNYRVANPSEIFTSTFSKIFPEISEGCNFVSIAGELPDIAQLSLIQNDTTCTTIGAKYLEKDNLCFRMDSGFTLMVGSCKKSKHEHAHPIGYSLNASDKPLVSCIEDLEFLSTVTNGGSIRINDWELVNSVDKWDYLIKFGELVEKIKNINEYNNQIMRNLYLHDLKNSEICKAITGLYGVLFHDPIAGVVPGFVIKDGDHGTRNTQVPRSGKIPFVFNIAGVKTLVWMVGEFDFIYNSDPVIIGVIITKRVSCEVFFDDTIEIEMGVAEMWVFPDWPAIRLMESSPAKIFSSTKSVKYKLECDSIEWNEEVGDNK